MNDEGVSDLRNAIIKQAIRDYKLAVKRNNYYSQRVINDVERFFKSAFCTLLLSDFEISGRDILKLLHEWRNEYLKREHKKRRPSRQAERDKHEEDFQQGKIH